jgi:hypothetical protein
LELAKVDLEIGVDVDVGWPDRSVRVATGMKPSQSRYETMRPSDQGLATKFLGLLFECRWFIRQEAVESAVDFRACEEGADGIIDEIRGVDRDEMWMHQLAQTSNLLEHLCRGKEMRCAADLDLRTQVHATYRTGEHDLIGGVLPALDANRRLHSFHRHAFVLRVCDMLAFRKSTHQIPPLGMEKLGVEGEIVPHRRETQPVHVLLGNREIIVIAGCVDEGKDAIGDTNGL